MYRLRKYWPLIILVALFVSACSPAATPTTAPQPTAPPKPAETTAPAQPATAAPAQPTAVPQPTAAPATDKRKVAKFIWTQEFDTLNRFYSNKWFAQILEQVWNAAAWEYDDKNEPFPVLVTEIPSPDNGGRPVIRTSVWSPHASEFDQWLMFTGDTIAVHPRFAGPNFAGRTRVRPYRWRRTR